MPWCIPLTKLKLFNFFVISIIIGSLTHGVVLEHFSIFFFLENGIHYKTLINIKEKQSLHKYYLYCKMLEQFSREIPRVQLFLESKP